MSTNRHATLIASSLLLVLAACSRKDDTATVSGSSDVRIDAAPDSNDPDSAGTRMCVNDDGEIFVLWVDDRDGQDDIWLNRSKNLGLEDSWLPAAVKVNSGDSNVWNPSIACSTQGVFVAWEDDRDGELQNHQIYFSVSLDGGESFSEDRLLELDDDGESMSLGPEIVAVGSDLYVAWFDNVNGAYDIMMAHSDNNGVDWDNPVRVDSDDPAGSAYSAWPQVQATGNGFVYVVWEDSRNGKSDIYFARSENAAATFKEDERLDGGDAAGANNSFAPDMSADGNNIYVVWHDERSGQQRDVFLNYSGNGGADWRNSAERVDSDNAGFFNSLFPTVVTDGAKGHVMWQDYRSDSAYDIYYREFNGGDPVAEEIRIDTGDEAGFNNSVNAQSVFNSGNVLVAWEDSRGEAVSGRDAGYNDLYYNFISGNGGFQETDLRIDSWPEGESFKVDLNIHLHQQWVFAAWTDGRLGTSDIFFTTLELGQAAEYIDPEDQQNGGGGGN